MVDFTGDWLHTGEPWYEDRGGDDYGMMADGGRDFADHLDAHRGGWEDNVREAMQDWRGFDDFQRGFDDWLDAESRSAESRMDEFRRQRERYL